MLEGRRRVKGLLSEERFSLKTVRIASFFVRDWGPVLRATKYLFLFVCRFDLFLYFLFRSFG